MSRSRKAPGIPQWLVVEDDGAKCLHCGKVESFEQLRLPMTFDAFAAWCKYVGELHRNCPVLAGEPSPEQEPR